MINLVKKTIIIAGIIFTLFSCAELNKELNKEAIDDFKPREFAKEKEKIIKETATIGPQVKDSTGKIQRRIFIDENIITNYTKIIDKNFTESFPISVNFDNVDIRMVMQIFSEITNRNILVGNEVNSFVNVRIINENWDDILEAILEIENLALTLNPNTKIVRVHEKDFLSAQEEYNRKRKIEIRRAMELAKSIAPVRSEIFKLYYSDPSTVKTQIEEVLANIDATSQIGGETENSGEINGASQRVKITVDERLRSLIVLGTLDDLDFIEKLVSKIDISTNQILIEAFVVEAGSDFDKELGSRVGALWGPAAIKGNTDVTIGGIVGGAATELSLGGTTGMISNQSAAGATGSLGILLNTTPYDLQIELTALESMGISKIISNPKVFTLDNETAVITQGVEIPYETVSSEGTETSFKEAALKLEVTPSIVGDGNIILDVKINKDSADTSLANPPISKTEISTKLLIADETIVVIGGIYKETLANTVNKTPILSDIPIIGNLFKNVKKGEDLDRLLIFIAPRIL